MSTTFRNRNRTFNAPRAIVYKGATYVKKVAADGKPLPAKNVLVSMFWKDPSMKREFLKALDRVIDGSTFEEDLVANAEKTLKKAGFTIDETTEDTVITAAWHLYAKVYDLIKKNWK